jgi:hypothetical protein
MQHLVTQGFARPQMLELYATVDTPEAAIETVTKKLGLGALQ